MNIDELKIIVSAIQQLGVEGKSAFIWWLVADKAVPMIGWLLAWLSLLVVAMKIVRALPGDRSYERTDLETARDLVRHVWLYGKHTSKSAQVRAVYEQIRALVSEKE